MTEIWIISNVLAVYVMSAKTGWQFFCKATKWFQVASTFADLKWECPIGTVFSEYWHGTELVLHVILEGNLLFSEAISNPWYFVACACLTCPDVRNKRLRSFYLFCTPAPHQISIGLTLHSNATIESTIQAKTKQNPPAASQTLPPVVEKSSIVDAVEEAVRHYLCWTHRTPCGHHFFSIHVPRPVSPSPSQNQTQPASHQSNPAPRR